MFRKEEALAKDWTPEKSMELSEIQKELIPVSYTHLSLHADNGVNEELRYKPVQPHHLPAFPHRIHMLFLLHSL